jgi:hypothetical protein
MKFLKLLLAGLALSLPLQCSTLNSEPLVTNINRQSEPFTDYKTFILGTWECDFRNNNFISKMSVTFKNDNMTEEYPLESKKYTVPYKFKGEKTIQVSRYPNNLIIERVSDNQLHFKPEADIREDIEIIYECSFIRAAEVEK